MAGRPDGKAPTNLARYGPRILLGGVFLGVTYTYFVTRPPKPQGTPIPNPMRTTGVKNIEGAYQSGGATATHTKAYGGTVLGQKEDVPRTGSATGKEKGFSSDDLGDEQRSWQPSKLGEKFKEMKYGDARDK